MIRGFYSSASGLVSQQSNMNIIANNMANTSTTGFKAQKANFSALLYENINGGDGNLIQGGHGTKVQSAAIDFSQGELQKTDMPMDCAIIGEGFFSAKSKQDGTNLYTRDGKFQVSVEGTETYLVNSKGDYILDEKSEKISLKDGFDVSKVGLYSFGNKYALIPVGGSQYKATETAGAATALKGGTVKVGYLENSGVAVSEEMVRMIEASKGFSFNAKLIQAADEMEKTINQLR